MAWVLSCLSRDMYSISRSHKTCAATTTLALKRRSHLYILNHDQGKGEATAHGPLKGGAFGCCQVEITVSQKKPVVSLFFMKRKREKYPYYGGWGS